MRLTGKTRKQLLLQNIVYCSLLVVLFCLLGWASVRYSMQFDWSADNRNSLSQTSLQVLTQLDKPASISVFIADDDPSANAVRAWLARYQRVSDQIELSFIDPQANPAETRRMNVTRRGQIIVQYDGRRERLDQFNEQNLTNALQRLIRGNERWVVFAGGHGERDPYGDGDQGLNQYTERLTEKGFKVQSLNPAVQGAIPDNTHVLVIAGPRNNYLPGEVRLIEQFVDGGGNLLWLAEPGGLAGLEPLAGKLGVKQLPGTVVDKALDMYGISQPGFTLIVNYPDSDVMPQIDQFTLFPHAFAWTAKDNESGFNRQSLLRTLPGSWTETGELENAEFDDNSEERQGPLDIGYTLSRELGEDTGKRTQRIAVIGDGDFLANGFIASGANLQLGVNLMNWLSGDEDLVDIEPARAPDTQLNISERYFYTIALLFIIVLPSALAAAGVTIWLRRRKA